MTTRRHSKGPGSQRRRRGDTGRMRRPSGGDGGRRTSKKDEPERQKAVSRIGEDLDLARIARRLFSLRSGRANYETIQKRILDGAKLDGMHVWALAAAMLIASIGLNINSTEAIIGAMLICPIMGSVLALSYGIATLDRELIRKAGLILVAQILICFVTSTLYFLISPLAGSTTAIGSNSTPTIWDVLIAFIGGFAGSLGTSRKNAPYTLVSGVAVATSLMPPLCTAGFGFATGAFVLMASAFYEFALNVTFITFGAELVFVMLRLPLRYEDLNGDGVIDDMDKAEVAKKAKKMRRRLTVGTIIFAIPCIFISANVVKQSLADTGTVFEVLDQYDTERTTRELKSICPVLVEYSIGTEDTYDMGSETIRQKIVAKVETIRQLDDQEQGQIEALIKINVENVDKVEFTVTDDLDHFTGTERIV